MIKQNGAGYYAVRLGTELLATGWTTQLAKALASELDRLRLLGPRQPPIELLVITGPLRIDIEACEVSVDGVSIKLKPREFAVLKALAQNLGFVLSRERILELGWPHPRTDSNRTVDVHIRRLRVKLGVAGGLIETVFGFGYKLVRREGSDNNKRFFG